MKFNCTAVDVLTLTFLPEVVCREPPSSTPDVSPKHSPCSDSRSQSQSSRRATRRRHCKWKSYSSAENQRLLELRSQRGLPWREVAKQFKHRTQASLQAQYSKLHSEAVVKLEVAWLQLDDTQIQVPSTAPIAPLLCRLPPPAVPG